MANDENSDRLKSYEKIFKLHRDKSDELCTMCFYLPIILQENPELKQEAFNVWDKVVTSPRNTRYSVEDTYSSLTRTVQNDKTMVPQAVNIFQKALASPKNDFETLCVAKHTLAEIAKANPAFATRSALAFSKALDAYEERITPKTPLKKFFQRLNDVNGRGEYIRQGLAQMREEIKDFFPKGFQRPVNDGHFLGA